MTQRQWTQKGYFRNVVRELKLELRKWMKKVFPRTLYALVIGTLYTVVFTTLVISIGMNFAPFFDTSFVIGKFPNVATWLPQKPFQQLPALAISTAALIALLAYNRGKRQSRSEFFFKQATHGLDEAYDLLRDQNNDRVIWVRAARSLLQAKKLAEEIELEEYQRAYRLYEHRVRNDFYLALTIPGQNPGQRQPLPPHFFFGLLDWKKDSEAGITLDDTAIKASNPIEAYRIVIDEVPPDPPHSPLSEASVIAIFDFLEYPEDYESPLDDVETWSKSWSDVHGASSGAARYIAHRQAKLALDGKLHDRPPVDDKT